MEKNAVSLNEKKESIKNKISNVENDLSDAKNNFRKIMALQSQLEGEIRQNKYQKERIEDRILIQTAKRQNLRELITRLKNNGEKTKSDLIKIEKI